MGRRNVTHVTKRGVKQYLEFSGLGVGGGGGLGPGDDVAGGGAIGGFAVGFAASNRWGRVVVPDSNRRYTQWAALF